MKRRSGAVAYVQYLLVRSAAVVLQIFPIDVNLRTARLLGRLWWSLDRRHQQRAREHLRTAFPEKPPDEIDRIGRECFQHWTMYAVEFFCAFRVLDEWTWPRHASLGNIKPLLELLLDKRGAILITPHYGNFEITAYLLAAVGFDIVALMRPLDNIYLNRFVVGTRTRRGLKLMDKMGAMSGAEEVLRRGGALGFVADQDAGRKGVFVDFFGRAASHYKSIALLAMQCNAPLVIGCARRSAPRFQYELAVQRVIQPEEWSDRADPMRWITREYADAMERIIRRAPE